MLSNHRIQRIEWGRRVGCRLDLPTTHPRRCDRLLRNVKGVTTMFFRNFTFLVFIASPLISNPSWALIATLRVTPSTSVTEAGVDVRLSVSGGVRPYVYSVSGPGTIYGTSPAKFRPSFMALRCPQLRSLFACKQGRSFKLLPSTGLLLIAFTGMA